MAKISDILAKATAKLKNAGAAIADAVAPATPSILAKDAPTSSNIGGGGVSLFEAKPGQEVETIGDKARKGLESVNTYIESSPTLSKFSSEGGTRKMFESIQENIIDKPAEIIGGIAPLVSDVLNDFTINYNPSETSLKVGEKIKSGISGAGKAVSSAPLTLLDTKDNFKGFTEAVSKGDKSEAARKLIDTATSSVSTLFSATPFGMGVRAISGGALGASGADKAIQGGKENIAKSISGLLGTDEKETLDWVGTIADASSLAAGIKGAKISQYKPTDILKTKTANLLKGAAVGSSADAFVAMFDTGEGRDKAIQGASLFLVNAFPSPLEAPKGRGKGPKSKKTSEIVEETKVTLPEEVDTKVPYDQTAKGKELELPEPIKIETPEETIKRNQEMRISQLAEEAKKKEEAKKNIPVETPEEYIRRNMEAGNIQKPEQPVTTTEQPIDKTITETVQDVPMVPEQKQEVVTAQQEIQKAVSPHVIEKPKFRLSVTNALQKLRGTLNTNITRKALLNNIIITDEGGKTGQTLNNYFTQGSKGIRYDVARNIINTFFPKESFKVDVKPDILIGGKTPEGIDITRENVGEFMQTLKDIEHEKLGAGFIDMESKDSIKLQKASFVYDLIKNDPEKLSKVFNEGQIKMLQELDTKEKQLYTKFAQYLVDQGIIKKIEESEDYIRFVMGQLGYERIKKLKGEGTTYKVVSNDGKITMEFDNFLDAERFLKFRNKFQGANAVKYNYDPATLNSLSKEKGAANLDLFRTHGALNRMTSYADMIGKLESDKFISDTINKSMADGSGVGDYLSQAFMSERHANILPEIMGIDTVKRGVVDKLGTAGVIGQMGLNLLSLGQQALSTALKTAAFAIANPGSAIKGGSSYLKDQKLKNMLASEGFNQAYEISPLSTDTTGKRILNIAMEAGTGNRAVESPAKSFIATVLAKKILKNNNIQYQHLADGWNQFKQAKPDEYKLARDKILDWTNWISDVSSSARLQAGNETFRNAFGKIKTYAIDQLDSSYRDLMSTGDVIVQKVLGKNYDEFTKQHGSDAVKRLSAGLAVTAGMYVTQLLLSEKELYEDDDTEEERALKTNLAHNIALEKTKRLTSPGFALDVAALYSGGKWNTAKSLQGLGGSIALAPVDATSTLVSMILSGFAPEGQKEIEFSRATNNLLKSFGAGRTYLAGKEILGISPDESLPDFSTKTSQGLERGVIGNSKFDKAVGFNKAQVVENFLREQITKIGDTDEGFIKETAQELSDTLSNFQPLRGWVNLIKDVANPEERQTAYDAFIIARNLPDKKYSTVKDMLVGEGIVAKDDEKLGAYEQMVTDAIIAQDQGKSGSIQAENVKTKKPLEISSDYNAIDAGLLSPGTASEQVMNAINGGLFQENPAMYTQAIGLLAKLKSGYGRKQDKQQRTFDDIVGDWKVTPSTNRIDAMVADATNTRAMSDTLTYLLDKKIGGFNTAMEELIAKGVAPDQKGRDKIMGMLGTINAIYGVGDAVGASPNALPISAATKMKGIFEKMSQAGMTNELKEVGKNMTNLYNAVIKGLVLRGETILPSTPNTQETGAGTGSLPISQMVSQAKTSPTTIAKPTGPITEPYVVPKWKELKNEWKGAFPAGQKSAKTQIRDPKLKKTSLSEMLRQSKK